MVRSHLAIAVLVAAVVAAAPAQSQTAPPAQQAPAASSTPAPKMSRFKRVREKLKEMRANWRANKPKLKACRAEVRKKGLEGDDRWFFIEECMEKS